MCVALLACLGLTGCYDESESRERILKIYSWADYIGDGVLEDFQKYYREKTGKSVRIVYQTFDINEIMLTKIERGHEDFDVVCPSEYIIERMLRKKMLLPIDTVFLNSPNYMHNVAPYIQGEMNKLTQKGDLAAGRYAVCYMWGTAGLLYNKQYLKEYELSSWGCLWDKRYAGKILMKDSYRDSYGTAMLYAHRRDLVSGRETVENLMNDYSTAAMDTVEKYLKLLKPNVAGWEADFGKEMMTKGKAWINMTWSGDAQWAIEEAAEVGVDLGYVIPEEGSNVWYDGWVIPKYAKNVEAASYFINFMCRPDIALRNMEATGYVSSVASDDILKASIDETADYVDASYFFGPEATHVKLRNTQYPDKSVVERCAMIRDFGDKTVNVLEIWSRVKGDNLNGGIVVLILVVVGSLCIFQIRRRYILYKRRNVQRRRRRCKKYR